MNRRRNSARRQARPARWSSIESGSGSARLELALGEHRRGRLALALQARPCAEERATCRVHISIPTVDEDAWEKLEPGVAHPNQRLRAVRELVDAGIDCGVLMAPIVPGFSTQPAKIERTIKAIAETGARSVGAMVMHLEGGTREDAMVNDNLYVASGGRNANGDKLPRILPKRFSQLMPKLKASDYDYIVFDMPAISPMSTTPRLGGYMDIVLLVLEAEKTGQQLAARATALMRESRANVVAVVNKYRPHVPARLSQEL